MAHPRQKESSDPVLLLQAAGVTGVTANYRAKEVIFAQGTPVHTIYYVAGGWVKLTVTSKQGREAVLEILPRGFIFGDASFMGANVRGASAMALSDCSIVGFKIEDMMRSIRQNHDFAQLLVRLLLLRNAQMRDDLADRLLNSSEQRLARLLLRLERSRQKAPPGAVIPKFDQQTLAQMVGTTRSRISFFMNRFRRLGFIEYNGVLRVHRSLAGVLRD